MGKFSRSFYSKEAKQKILRLQAESCFNLIRDDVTSGKVYPALRDDSIDFYYLGARLCHYEDGRFEWHKNMQCKSLDDYNAIKDQCNDWGRRKDGTDNERSVLSELWKMYSPYIKNDLTFVLLDIEVGFPRLCLNEDERQNNVQIDLLFLDLKAGMLYFVEAKESSDSRLKLYADNNETLDMLYGRLEEEQDKIGYQLIKYRRNLKHREREILSAYQDYCVIMRSIFGESISLPSMNEAEKKCLSLYPEPKLFVYGEKPASIHAIRCMDALKQRLGRDLIAHYNVEGKVQVGKLSQADIISEE